LFEVDHEAVEVGERKMRIADVGDLKNFDAAFVLWRTLF
jgi:hypothetical protein